MSLYDTFFFVTFIVIILIWVFVYYFQKPSPTIKNFRLHHWMYGLAIILILFCISNIYTNIYMLSIGIGLFLDEIGFILLRGKTHEDNYSPKSFMILLVFILFLFIFKEYIVNFYLK